MLFTNKQTAIRTVLPPKVAEVKSKRNDSTLPRRGLSVIGYSSEFWNFIKEPHPILKLKCFILPMFVR